MLQTVGVLWWAVTNAFMTKTKHTMSPSSRRLAVMGGMQHSGLWMRDTQQSVVRRCAPPGRRLQHEASSDGRRDERCAQWCPHLEESARQHPRPVWRRRHAAGERKPSILKIPFKLLLKYIKISWVSTCSLIIGAILYLSLCCITCPHPIIPSAVCGLRGAADHTRLFFFFFSSIGKEKIPLGTQVITFFRGECVGSGAVWAVCSHRQ